VRSLLATGSPSMVSAITSAARARLLHTHFKSRPRSHVLFLRGPSDDTIVPTSHLTDTLAYARTLFGAGMGFASLRVLASVVRASIGVRWELDSEMADALALVDADICQALQVRHRPSYRLYLISDLRIHRAQGKNLSQGITLTSPKLVRP
jgi:hypothetical protein